MSKEELSKQYADKKTSESPRNVYRFLPLEKQKELTCFDGYEIEVAYEDGFDKAMEEIRKEIERPLESIPFDVEVERYRKEKGADNIRYYECARHFAEWQKQQLMKDVVEVEYWDGSLFKNELRERFKDGDKVKLIIIKENEKVIKS